MEPNSDPSQIAESERGELIERMVMDIMHKHDCRRVSDIVVNLQRLDKEIGVDEIHSAVRRLEVTGSINLSEEKPAVSFLSDLTHVGTNARFWVAVAASAAILIAIYVLPQGEPWVATRWIAGAIFLFVIPGYTITNLFIPRNRLSTIERVAISVGLSLATVVLIGIILSYSPVGVRIEPIVISIALFNVVIALLAAEKDYSMRERAFDMHSRLLHDEQRKEVTGGRHEND
ncbi:MAG: DUF1616 domain-containing protein [Nitrososphaera sp.]